MTATSPIPFLPLEDPEEARIRNMLDRVVATAKSADIPVRELVDTPVCGDTLARVRSAYSVGSRRRH
jgi:hypothetical protein